MAEVAVATKLGDELDALEREVSNAREFARAGHEYQASVYVRRARTITARILRILERRWQR